MYVCIVYGCRTVVYRLVVHMNSTNVYGIIMMVTVYSTDEGGLLLYTFARFHLQHNPINHSPVDSGAGRVKSMM